MTIQLIASGRPCKICETRDPADEHALRDGSQGEPYSFELDPTAIVRRTNVQVDENGQKTEYPYHDRSQAGSVPARVRDSIVYNVFEDGKSLGEYCAKCIKSACETTNDTEERGVDVLRHMLNLVKGPKANAAL